MRPSSAANDSSLRRFVVPLPHPDPAKRVDLALRVYRERLARVETIDAELRRISGCPADCGLPDELEADPALHEATRRLERARGRLTRFMRAARKR